MVRECCVKDSTTTIPVSDNHISATRLAGQVHSGHNASRNDDRSHLLEQIEEAVRVIAPLWPLSTFIAVNPLWDLRHISFYDAIDYAAPILGIRGYPTEAFFAEAYACGRVTMADLRAVISDTNTNDSITEDFHLYGLNTKSPEAPATDTTEVRPHNTNNTFIDHVIDRELTKWCAAYIGGMLPGKTGGGFYQAWHGIIGEDPAARRIAGKDGRRELVAMPENAIDTILECLDRLSINKNDRVNEIERRFARTLGWSGYAKWRSYWAPINYSESDITTVDLLAVRLSYEAVLSCMNRPLRPTRFAALVRRPSRHSHLDTKKRQLKEVDQSKKAIQPEHNNCSVKRIRPDHIPPKVLKKVWLTAYENHYRDWLLKTLDGSPRTATGRKQPASRLRPTAQAVFCIDTRSEGIRRHLEDAGHYETIGFAGFFSLPMRYLPLGSAGHVDQYPVLLSPAIEVTELPSTETALLANHHIATRQGLAAAGYALNSARKGMLSAFMLAEAGGFFAGPLAATKTLTPRHYHKVRTWIHRMIVPHVETHNRVCPSISISEQASLAENLLTTMGLTRNFAPLVLLCGHGSTTENNPHASSLDCGACGGNRGAANARAATALLNQPTIRKLLRERKVIIPEDTIFIAGEHDTANDEVTIFDLHLIPDSHLDMVATLQDDLNRAGKDLAVERASTLPGAQTHGNIALPEVRSTDWAQVQPEWGLAGNASFIVAPRELTAGVDLGRRCFLHSYDSDTDPNGTILETILTAPMVVAHWINAQYYFSTVDPEVLSAGDKTAHNIIAGIGVLQGAGGDLQVGLPRQSIFDGNKPFHEPVRLLTIVQAPQKLLDNVISRNVVLCELFDGSWVHLVARDHPYDTWKMRQPGGGWKHWKPAE